MSSRNSPSTFDAKLAYLIASLEELCDLLRGRDEHWYAWSYRALFEIKRYDTRGLDRLLGAYGGMGSFNDLVLGPADDQFTSEEIGLNNRLDQLRTVCWELATDLRRELPA